MTGHAHSDLSHRERRLLVGLADGTLRGRRRARAEALVRELPGGGAVVERQRRVRRALGGGWAPTAVAPAPRLGLVRRWAPRAALVGAAVAALMLALVVPAAKHGSIVAQAADLSKQPATAPAPTSAGSVLRADVEGVSFPDWTRKFGWRETGSRRDTLDGRATKTVFYEHMGHRIAYTILPGAPARPPEGSRIVRRNGTEIAISRDPSHGGHDIAVFQRGGRTCVLAGHVMRIETLVKLAAWTGRPA